MEGHWQDSNASDRFPSGKGCHGFVVEADEKGSHGSCGWMAGIPRFEQEGLCSRCDSAPQKKECSYRTTPTGSTRYIALEALRSSELTTAQ